MEKNIEYFGKVVGDNATVKSFASLASARQNAIQHILWNEEMSQWFDVWLSSKKCKLSPVDNKTVSLCTQRWWIARGPMFMFFKQYSKNSVIESSVVNCDQIFSSIVFCPVSTFFLLCKSECRWWKVSLGFSRLLSQSWGSSKRDQNMYSYMKPDAHLQVVYEWEQKRLAFASNFVPLWVRILSPGEWCHLNCCNQLINRYIYGLAHCHQAFDMRGCGRRG